MMIHFHSSLVIRCIPDSTVFLGYHAPIASGVLHHVPLVSQFNSTLKGVVSVPKVKLFHVWYIYTHIYMHIYVYIYSQTVKYGSFNIRRSWRNRNTFRFYEIKGYKNEIIDIKGIMMNIIQIRCLCNLKKTIQNCIAPVIRVELTMSTKKESAGIFEVSKREYVPRRKYKVHQIEVP